MKISALAYKSKLTIDYTVTSPENPVSNKGRKYSVGLEEMSHRRTFEIDGTIYGLFLQVEVKLSRKSLLSLTFDSSRCDLFPERGDLLSSKVERMMECLLSSKISRNGEEFNFKLPSGEVVSQLVFINIFESNGIEGYQTDLFFQK